jgi:hypothetical protein
MKKTNKVLAIIIYYIFILLLFYSSSGCVRSRNSRNLEPNGIDKPTTESIYPTDTIILPTPTIDNESEISSEINVIFIPLTSGNIQHIEELVSGSVSNAKEFIWLKLGEAIALSTDLSVLNIKTKSQTIIDGSEIAVNTPTQLSGNRSGNSYVWKDVYNVIFSIKETRVNQGALKSEFESPISSLAVSENGEYLAVSTVDGSLLVLESSTMSIINSWEYPFWLSNLSFSPDNAIIAGVDSSEFALFFIDAVTGEIINELSWMDSASPILNGAYFSPGWENVAWVARGTVQLMDIESGSSGSVFYHEDTVNKVAWSDDGSLIATTSIVTTEGDYSPAVFIWDTDTGELLNTIKFPEVPIDISFSPDGLMLGILLNSGKFIVWGIPN